MLNFLDVYERALKGPIMNEHDFDMKVFIPTLRRVVDEYEIQYDNENPLPANDPAAENLFNAAVDFLSQTGVYCQDTSRVIQFSKKGAEYGLNYEGWPEHLVNELQMSYFKNHYFETVLEEISGNRITIRIKNR